MRSLYDKDAEHSSCGVGFITHKLSLQTHELLNLSHQALCKIPHRGGMNAQGIGDGAGVNIDLSVNFYRYLTNDNSLEYGDFGVGNFFYPLNSNAHQTAESIISKALEKHDLSLLLWRDVEVDISAVNEASAKEQLSIRQVVFSRPSSASSQKEFEAIINEALLEIEEPAFQDEYLQGFYPLSMSSYTQVYKGRLNSWEVVPYFKDLQHPEHCIKTLFFHTRFSTNTAPNPIFAQPFRRMAHNGELNTDRKNRLSENAIAMSHNKQLIFPKGQSDSARLDQTLARRITEDDMDIVESVLAMMPPAWENDETLSSEVRDMLEYFSLSEEKNDGPAALVFSDGIKVGARLDRLGLRPLRTVETDEYLAVMSEAGQIDFPPESIVRRGRVDAGGMVVFNHENGEILYTKEVLERLATQADYPALVEKTRLNLTDLPALSLADVSVQSDLSIPARMVAYSMNQESFKFMLDPMLQTGLEKISAMGYGIAPNALNEDEGGMSRYFSQRFAQVTNPPLDSIREADGMTLRVALGPKPNFYNGKDSNKPHQLVLNSPILQLPQLQQIRLQDNLSVETVETLFTPDLTNEANNQANLLAAVETVCSQVETLVRAGGEIIILSDRNISTNQAAIPAIMIMAAVNQRLIKAGLSFNCSVVMETGQASNTHDIACLLGFGAAAVCSLTVYYRALELSNSNEEAQAALNKFQKAVEKALMKTMGKFGLCTAESYIGGEFFESNFLDTKEPLLATIFPNIDAPIGGVQFADLAKSAATWHAKVTEIQSENEIPVLGLFKERGDGAGHTFGNTSVREYLNMTEEDIQYIDESTDESEAIEQTALPQDDSYRDLGFEKRTDEQLNNATITPAYRSFCENLYAERDERPASLRDVLHLAVNLCDAVSTEDFAQKLSIFNLEGNASYPVQGLQVECTEDNQWQLSLSEPSTERHQALADAIISQFKCETPSTVLNVSAEQLVMVLNDTAVQFFSKLYTAPQPIDLTQVQPACEITSALASGAMSHGALVSRAHEAVAQGTNIVGAMSNCGEGGENSRRYNTIKGSKIKQFASGRFGIWTGYLADPCLEEIEIKLAQGAKPGEGGQLPAAKVDVEIAAARCATPGVELISPPPHHDTYSIEDLGQLIHDAKAARVRVIVKLVSSEGIGTIAVGVAKAGADVINVAGNTGGTGAAQVTSLKNTGRSADVGIAEVHQALSENGLRDKVVLRCSNSHQTGLDVVKSALMGGDSFEFGTTALMMLKCVMAKNCNVKCPAGLTTNAEMYEGDPRALAQYFINLAHEVREILASMGYPSLRSIRGKSQLMALINHKSLIGRLDMTGMLREADTITYEKPVYLEADFTPDDNYLVEFEQNFIKQQAASIDIQGPALHNCNKTTSGQFAVDIERILNYTLSEEEKRAHPSIMQLSNGRWVLAQDSVTIHTSNSAGQSFGAFNNTGMKLVHTGTCNDGVAKAASGGVIVIKNPNKEAHPLSDNVLIGNFALFGATGGRVFIQGLAGDRFGVRNSGSVAVVEGVGDFGCEYMTHGSVVNLGEYGKGFGNGMSGGTAYQYDPSGDIVKRCSQDSVIAIPMTSDDQLVTGQEQALLIHLEQHAEYSRSSLAKKLLDNWQESRQHFYVVLPRPMLSHQQSSSILAATKTAQMQEELAQFFANQQLTLLIDAYQNDQASIFNSQVPQYGECDSPLILKYIITTGVLRRSLELAQKANPSAEQSQTDIMAKALIQQKDRKLVDALVKDMKASLAGYSDDALAALLAQKRVSDYKRSLEIREVWDIHSMGTNAWIIERDRQSLAELAEHPELDEQIAKHYMKVIADVMRSQAA
ncbi:glutamate synthase-related protein [Marinomonas sp. C2222]|uniref:Glutamate synthase-related protein n=1 Tax=Marinomonas sargassi TaxID=2984494 RepID=A0ABT2YRN5_9GAMM|nr:glutamate synthase-related protein [Marinomonas sargassi]MCV2402535.1 glutamate synthase-related protein [Marinomonas sargassi]